MDSFISRGFFSLVHPYLPICCLLWLISPLISLGQQTTGSSPGLVGTLAFFLDSADTIEPGSVWIGTVFTARKSPTGKELDVPALSLSYGLHRKIQLDFSIPYFEADYGPDFQ